MMRWLLLSSLLVQSAPAPSEADKLEDALKKFGNRSYRIIEEGKESGKMTTKSHIEKEGDQVRAVFEDKIAVRVGDIDVAMTWTEKASRNDLRLMASHRKGVGPNGPFDALVTVKDNKAVLKSASESTIEITPAAVGHLAVLRLVCMAEQKKDATFKVDLLSLISLGFEPGHEFRCLGKEEIEVGGKKVGAFKWEEKGEWKIKRSIQGAQVTLTNSIENFYWVAEEGYLVRFSTGTMEMVLDAK